MSRRWWILGIGLALVVALSSLALATLHRRPNDARLAESVEPTAASPTIPQRLAPRPVLTPMPRGASEPPAGPPTPAESAAQRRQMRQDLGYEFRSRRANTAWSNSSASHLQAFLAALAAGAPAFGVEGAECRELMCKARLTATDATTIPVLAKRAVDTRSEFSRCAFAFVTDPDETGAEYFAELFWLCSDAGSQSAAGAL
jgi:hypothetical protein